MRHLVLTLAILGSAALAYPKAEAVGAPLAPTTHLLSQFRASELLENAQYRRHDRRWRGDRYRFRRDYDRRWYGPRHHRRYVNPGAAAAAGIAGLAAGAILGGALQDAQASDGRRDWLEYCSQKYKSFDPATGTYLGYDGERHACR